MPFEVFAHERNINIITYFRLCTPFWIFDVEYMRKAIINLISNAVKFTPDYGKISLYVAYRQRQPYLAVHRYKRYR